MEEDVSQRNAGYLSNVITQNNANPRPAPAVLALRPQPGDILNEYG